MSMSALVCRLPQQFRRCVDERPTEILVLCPCTYPDGGHGRPWNACNANDTRRAYGAKQAHVPTMPAKSAVPSTTAMPAAASAIDINSADAAQLESLPGIGPAKSKAIIDYRTKNGPFQNAADLEKVPGIGPKTMEQLAPLIMVKQGMPSVPAVKK